MRKLSKILALALVLMMAFAVISAFSFTTSAASTSVRVYCDNQANYSGTMYCYYWGGSNGPTWPGKAMSKDAATGYWYYDIPAGHNMVIFTNKNAGSWQTGNLNVPTTDAVVFNNKTNTWSQYIPPQAGHTCNWVEDKDQYVAPTCTETGKKVYNCAAEGCSTKTKSTTLSALGHNYSGTTCTRCSAVAVFTVAGNGAHIGKEWDPGNAANDMTYADGVYTKVYTNVAAGSYGLKCVRDHSWDVGYGGIGATADKDGNYKYTVATSGSTVTVTLKGTTVTVTVEAPHVCSFVDGKCTCGKFDPTYTVVGSLEELKAALLNGGNILLNADITSSEIIVIGKSTVLVGGGHTITSTAARAINISGADGVTIKNLTVAAGGERAFNVIQNATNIVLDNVTATSWNYTVNVAGSAANAVVTIKNADLTGLNVINVAGAGAQITISDTKITCDDQNDLEGYGAITVGPNCPGVTLVGTGVEFDIKGDSSKVANNSQANITFTDADVEIVNNVAMIRYGDYAYTYTKLEDAIKSAARGETVVLLDDIAVESLTVPYWVTIDTNGHELTGNVTYELPKFPEVVVTDIINNLENCDNPLTFALNFSIKDLEAILADQVYLDALFAAYGDMYVDYRLTINGLSVDKVVFNANGTANGYLGGQYDEWSANWVYVPFENVEVANGESLYIMEYAAKLMGKTGLRYTLAEVVAVVANFDCGVYFTPEFLADNHDMKVTLELVVFTEDAEGNKTFLNDAPIATNEFYANTHEYTAVVTDPTCTEEGYTTYTCACGAHYIADKVPAYGHDIVVDAAVDATCTKTGLTAGEHCSRCDHEVAQEVVPAKGHNYVNGTCTVCKTNILYFINTEKWTKVNAYMWDVANNGWPGAAMTKTGEQINGYDVYKVEYTAAYVNVIFNNGSSQTADLVIAKGQYFCPLNSIWYKSASEVPSFEGITKTNYFLPGEFNSWKDANAFLKEGESTVIRSYVALAANKTYTFKVKTGSTWYGSTGTVTAANATIQFSTTGTNAKITTACAGLYIFEYDTSTKKLTVIYPCAEEVVPGKAATCTETGLTEGKKCSVCGTVIVAQKVVPVLEHNFGEWSETTAPTCTEKGVDTRACADCGATETRDVDAKGHNEEVVAGKDATCTETGLTEGKKCTVCGTVTVAQEEIPAKGHSFGEWAETTAPTCTEKGVDTRACANCDATETRDVDAKGHNEEVVAGKDATCTETGLTEGKKCTVCGTVTVAQEEIPAKGHTEEVVAGKAATCTEAGLTEGKKCSVCGEVLAVQEEIPATGHNYVDGKCECGAEEPKVEEPAVDEEPELNIFQKIIAWFKALIEKLLALFKRD